MGFKSLRRKLENNPAFNELMDEEYPYRHVGDAIATLRINAGLTQEALADKASTTQPVIARIESGRHAVGAELLNRIADALEMTWAPTFTPLPVEYKFQPQAPSPGNRTSEAPTPARGTIVENTGVVAEFRFISAHTTSTGEVPVVNEVVSLDRRRLPRPNRRSGRASTPHTMPMVAVG